MRYGNCLFVLEGPWLCRSRTKHLVRGFAVPSIAHDINQCIKSSVCMRLRLSESGESLFVFHLRINDNGYLLILLSRLSASTQASFDHQLHNSLQAVEALFWCHFAFLQVR